MTFPGKIWVKGNTWIFNSEDLLNIYSINIGAEPIHDRSHAHVALIAQLVEHCTEKVVGSSPVQSLNFF